MGNRASRRTRKYFFRHVIAVTVAIGLLSPGALAEEPADLVGKAEAELLDDRVIPGRGDPDGARAADLPLAITNPELFKPIPLPHASPQVEGEEQVPLGQFVTRDLITGEITYGPVSEMPGLSGSTPGGRGATVDWPELDDPAAKNFGALTLVSNPTTGQYPTAVKIYMTFQDAGGSNHYFVGSGTMIDPQHVLTAGHCVFDNDDSYGWATEITIVPAFDSPDQPFGFAQGTSLHSWTGWTVDDSWDHDIGYIGLAKPIGALTGWRGYGYHNDPNYYTTTTWVHNGYPAETPYDGDDMYTQSGDFDSTEYAMGAWYGGNVTFDRRSYGGSSGSGAVKDGIVRAVLSSGTSTWTQDARITSDKFTTIGATILGHKPVALDMVPMNCRASTTVVAGSRLASFDFLVHNYSNGSGSDTYNFDVYISTNDNISTADTKIGSYNFTHSFTPLSSVRLNFGTPPLIPASTSGGNYWIGVIITSTDADAANNDTDGWDAAPINVLPAQPDLTITSLTHSPPNPTTADLITFTAIVWNIGDATAGASTLEIRVGGEGVGTYYPVPALAPGGSYPVVRQEVLSVAQGYGYEATADVLGAIAESDEANNSRTGSLIVSPAQPDLTVTSLTHNPPNPTTVDLITFTAIVRNIGDATAGASTLELRVGGEPVGTYYPVPALAPGGSYPVERHEVLPVAQGYVYEATADVLGAIAESDEANNSRTGNVFVSPASVPVIQVSTAAPGPVSVRNWPNGWGSSLDSAHYWDGVPGHPPVPVDATITIRVTDDVGTPIANLPADAFWLETSLGGLAPCSPMSLIADGPTDVNGITTISGPFFAGGHSDFAAGEQAIVVFEGTPLDDQPLDIFFNSGDIDGSGFVNLTDAGHFVTDLFGPYNYRSDFVWDGDINLSDAGVVATMLGASCPAAAAKAGPEVADGQLGLYLDPRGVSAAATLDGRQEITAYLLLSGGISSQGVRAWECGLELPDNVRILSSELTAPAHNMMGSPNFVVGAGKPLHAESGGLLLLATLQLRVLDDNPATVRLQASSLASLGTGAAVIAIGDDLELKALPITAGDAQGTAIWLNDPAAPDWAVGPAVANLDLHAAPNPFNPQTEIRFNLSRPGDVAIRIYDVRGRLVRALAPGRTAAGPQAVVWDGKNAGGATSASGIYFGQLLLDGKLVGPTLKMSVLK